MTTHHCDRCRATILGNRSVLRAIHGELSLSLPEPIDLCEACRDGFMRWLHGAGDLGRLPSPAEVAEKEG